MDRDESPLPHRLTDMQLEALDILSVDYGVTNRELTRRLKESNISSMLTEQELAKSLERIEKSEGNVFNKVTKPLLERGIVYQVKGERYPKKMLYINKFIDNMWKIQHDLADPLEGRIWYYDKTHYIEQKEYNKKKRDYMKNHEEALDISNNHLKARQALTSFLHLYCWCDKIKKEINDVVQNHRMRYDSFCLVTQTPPCKRCQEIQRRIKFEEYFQECQRILWQQERFLAIIKTNVQYGISDLRELQLTRLGVLPEKD